MARRPVVVDPERKAVVEQIGAEIVEKLNGVFFEVDGTPMATVKYPDGSFKRKTLMAGWEFAVTYSYVGARGTLLLGLTPEDSQEYEFVEMDLKDLDIYFPLIGPALAKVSGRTGAENLCIIVETMVDEHLSRKVQQAKEAEDGYSTNPVFGMF